MGKSLARRKNDTFTIASIDQPQIAEEMTWAAKARQSIQRKMTGQWLDEYWQSVMDRAKAGDRVACQQIDRMLGIGQPVKIEVHGHVQPAPADEPLEAQIERELLHQDEPQTFAALAARLQVAEQEVAACVRSNLDLFYMPGPREVTLAGSM